MSRDDDARSSRLTWPASRWPTSNELLEYARVAPTAEVLEYFELLLPIASRGRRCLAENHGSTISDLAHQVTRLTEQKKRMRTALRNARRRARNLAGRSSS